MTRVLGSRTALALAATVILFATVTSSAIAGESGALSSPSSPPLTPPKYYEQPDGFGGRKWGDPLLSFERLDIEPIAIDASYSDGSDVSPHFRCIQVGEDTCDLTATLAGIPTRRPHAYILVTQHRIEDQGFRIAGVTMYPVTHFFCAHWPEFLKEAPSDIASKLQYCGIRSEFDSANLEQLATLPPDHVTEYQHVLRHMVLTYGRPFGYKGRVRVESTDDSVREARREFPHRYRWCTDMDSIFAPKCNVKISLTFDVETGKGSVLMSAQLLHQFATSQLGNLPGKRGALYREIFTDRRTE